MDEGICCIDIMASPSRIGGIWDKVTRSFRCAAKLSCSITRHSRLSPSIRVACYPQRLPSIVVLDCSSPKLRSFASTHFVQYSNLGSTFYSWSTATTHQVTIDICSFRPSYSKPSCLTYPTIHDERIKCSFPRQSYSHLHISF